MGKSDDRPDIFDFDKGSAIYLPKFPLKTIETKNDQLIPAQFD